MIEPTPRDLRVFGALLPVFFLVIGITLGHRLHSTWTRDVIWGAGAMLTVAYLAVPRWRRPVFSGFSRATRPIGAAVSYILLTFVFVAVVTPIAIALRVLKGDPLSRRADPSAPSYWEPKSGPAHPRRYLQQF